MSVPCYLNFRYSHSLHLSVRSLSTCPQSNHYNFFLVIIHIKRHIFKYFKLHFCELILQWLFVKAEYTYKACKAKCFHIFFQFFFFWLSLSSIIKPILSVQKASCFPLAYIFHVCDNMGIQIIITKIFTFFECLLRKMMWVRTIQIPTLGEKRLKHLSKLTG